MTDQPQRRTSRGRTSRHVRRWRIIALAVLILLPLVGWYVMIRMPGSSFQGELPPLTPAQQAYAQRLRADLTVLADEIGERNVKEYASLRQAENFLTARLEEAGFQVRRLPYDVHGVQCSNLEVELSGGSAADEIVVVGAHYDSVIGTPGADDNGSGAVAVLALAEALAGAQFPRTVRMVEFVNEEPPYFQTELMGSHVYARDCADRGDNIVAMFSLEMLGYYSQEPGSQNYPFPFSMFYPSEGDFIAFISNVGSRSLVHQSIAAFRQSAQFPSEGAALPTSVPGVGFSDQWSFWQFGYPAVMVTDTAFNRNPHYHTAGDTVETIDYERMARVTAGLEQVIRKIASGGE